MRTWSWGWRGDGEEGKPAEEKKEEKWDVNNPPGPSSEVTIDTDEGTWLSLDVSPDGSFIVTSWHDAAPGASVRGTLVRVDMTTGVSRVESDSGKVQGLFLQGQGQGCGSTTAGPSPAIPSLIPGKPK